MKKLLNLFSTVPKPKKVIDVEHEKKIELQRLKSEEFIAIT